MSKVCTMIRGQMSNSANQFGGRCPYTSFFKGGQMSGGEHVLHSSNVHLF